MDVIRNFLWTEILSFGFLARLFGCLITLVGAIFRRGWIRKLEQQIAELKHRQETTNTVPRQVSLWYVPGQGGMWRETQVPLGQGLTHRVHFDDCGRENIIQVNKAYRIVFTDPRSGDFWGEQVDGDIRRYRSGPFSKGYGLRDVFLMIELADEKEFEV